MPLCAVVDTRDATTGIKQRGDIISVYWLETYKNGMQVLGQSRQARHFTHICLDDPELEAQLQAQADAGERRPVLTYPYAIYEEQQEEVDGEIITNQIMVNRSRYRFNFDLFSSSSAQVFGLSDKGKLLDKVTPTPMIWKPKTAQIHNDFTKVDLIDDPSTRS
jgi:hypothetical protein